MSTLSVREDGAKEFGTRTEMKNLELLQGNRPRDRGRRRARQIDLIESGEKGRTGDTPLG